ncbi:hypothetical protein QR98_0057680, partial [Sarcoptes scabiei]
IYLATDEIDVWRTEVPSFKRKGYQFVGEIEHTKTAAPVQRFQIESYENFLLDVYALSRKDYRVCTLNSHLCRLAYELIQIDRDYDMSQNVISLDDVYYFGGQRFDPGQTLGIESDSHEGYYIGDLQDSRDNIISHRKLSYPSFKTKESIVAVSFGTFSRVQ